MALIGRGVISGMGVTLKTFFDSYPWGRAVLRVFGQPPGDGITTIEYPDVKQQHAERFRYFPFLVYDETPDNLHQFLQGEGGQVIFPNNNRLLFERVKK